MTIPLLTASGLFPRVGDFGTVLDSVNTYRGTTVPPMFNTIRDAFNGSQQDVTDTIYTTLSQFQSSCNGIAGAMQALAKSTVIEMVNADVYQPNQTIGTAIGVLISQMQARSQTVKGCTVTVSILPGPSNIGNAVVRATEKNVAGITSENIFTENATGTVTTDSYVGTSVSGQESITFLGQNSETNYLNYDYPLGSGGKAITSCVDPTGQQGTGNTGNWLVNGNFETFTTNTPSKWTIRTGTAGTTVYQNTSQHYDGLSSVMFAGNGSELTAIDQEFANSTSGTKLRIQPNSVYAFNLWTYLNATTVSGVLEVALVDSTGTIILNASGGQNKATLSLSTLTPSSWGAFGGFFQTPPILPSIVRLRIRLSTALPSGKNLSIDRVGFAIPVQFYTGGEYLASFSGSVPSAIGDYYVLSANNNYAGKFQRLFEKFCSMRQLGYQLPSKTDGSQTIPDY